MRIALLAAAVLLSACAAPGQGGEEPVFEDAYTPTGSLIPRKNADRDGKRVILSKENAQKAVEEVQRLGGGTVLPP
ncbi:hypothetical protein OU994_29890 [Pseudoduganella sp. SL102]|uniref:hypothetical protein n=1 Tax=Pseudoduganella sp. SL102 TaxID=2995154 RepID=UPI00248AA8E4|nr:hypothetical protein [Pseudoduganella sp. SL102]WBS02406.1 hypothetical protein OU994_29890 [Pseudoduganella sp. SL102]